MENKYFETTSRIIKNDTKRFIERINYESMCGLEGTVDEYCDELQIMINNHIEVQDFEIAEGLKRTIEQLKEP